MRKAEKVGKNADNRSKKNSVGGRQVLAVDLLRGFLSSLEIINLLRWSTGLNSWSTGLNSCRAFLARAAALLSRTAKNETTVCAWPFYTRSMMLGSRIYYLRAMMHAAFEEKRTRGWQILKIRL